MPLVGYIPCVLLIIMCGSLQISAKCMSDIMIGPNSEKQVHKTDKQYMNFYALHHKMTYIKVALQFTFGEETLRFPTKKCIGESSCLQEVEVRTVKDRNGWKPSKWAVKLRVGNCSLKQTYSYLYTLNSVNSLSILADGPSKFYTTERSRECLRQLNTSHCPSLNNFIEPKDPEVTDVHTGIIVVCVTLPIVATLIGIFLFRRIKKISESTLELASVVSTGSRSDIISQYAPSLPEVRSIYFIPNPSFRTNSCPPFPTRPCPLIPETSEASPEDPTDDTEHIYAEATWIDCGSGACGGRSADSLKGDCGVTQGTDANRDTENHYEVCD